MSERRRIAIPVAWALLLVAIMASTGFWLFHSVGDRPSSGQETNPVRMTIEDKTTATGQIVPRKQVKIKSQANGVLDEILVKPGQWVKQGDLIARIHLQPDPVEVNNAQSQINNTRLEHERAAVELKRGQRLHDQRLISDAAFQDNRLKYDLTRAALEQAKRELELRMKGASQQFQTTSTIITATVAGMVLECPVDIGDFIIKTNDLNEGTTVATLADTHNLIFKGQVEEADAGRLQEGMPLSVTVGALPEERFEAVLESIAPEGRKTDQGRITFEIRAAIRPKPELFLRPGYSATGEIIFARHERVLAIPESYLLFHNQAPHVRVEVEQGKAVERKITVGLSDGLHIEVISGLDEQDRVVAPETPEAQ